MNLQETNRLLTFAKAVDNRKVDDATIVAWQAILVDIDPADATQAVRDHFAASSEYLMPIHVLNGAAAAKRERARLAREAKETEEQRAIEAAPRTDRRAEIAAFIRGINGPGDPDKLRSREAYWRREHLIHRPRVEEPNPHFAGWTGSPTEQADSNS